MHRLTDWSAPWLWLVQTDVSGTGRAVQASKLVCFLAMAVAVAVCRQPYLGLVHGLPAVKL